MGYKINPDKKKRILYLKLLLKDFLIVSGFIYLSGFPLKSRYRDFNGSEFSSPSSLEYSTTGRQRTILFYCHARSANEKGSCEKNHEFFRRISPKSKPMDDLLQSDIDVMMSHINCYCRPKFNNKTPYDMFKVFYGKSFLDRLGLVYVAPNDVILKPKLIQNRIKARKEEKKWLK